jgi:hypothetical protein
MSGMLGMVAARKAVVYHAEACKKLETVVADFTDSGSSSSTMAREG